LLIVYTGNYKGYISVYDNTGIGGYHPDIAETENWVVND